MKEKEACLGRHSNLLLSADAVVGVEDGLTATALIIASCRPCQIEEQGPGSSDGNRWWLADGATVGPGILRSGGGRVQGQRVGIVVCV